MVTEYQPKEGEKGGNLVYFCDLCRVRCDSSTIVSHLNGLKHRIAFLVSLHQIMVTPSIDSRKKINISLVSEESVGYLYKVKKKDLKHEPVVALWSANEIFYLAFTSDCKR